MNWMKRRFENWLRNLRYSATLPQSRTVTVLQFYRVHRCMILTATMWTGYYLNRESMEQTDLMFLLSITSVLDVAFLYAAWIAFLQLG